MVIHKNRLPREAVPGAVQSQAGWAFEQPDLVEVYLPIEKFCENSVNQSVNLSIHS